MHARERELRLLQVLIDHGIPLVQGLELVGWYDERRKVMAGLDLSDAMEDTFDPRAVGVVRLAERYGALQAALAQLADWYGTPEDYDAVDDLTRFATHLRAAVWWGLPLSDALKMQVLTAHPKGIGRVLERVIAEIEAGGPMCEPMARHPDLFPPAAVAILRVAERCGDIPSTLEAIAKNAALFFEVRE